MIMVAIGAGNPLVRMHRPTPHITRSAGILFMALGANFRPLGRLHGLKSQDQTWLFAACFQVPARRSVALLATLFSVDIPSKGLTVRFMACSTKLVIIHILRVWNGGDGHLDSPQSRLLKRHFAHWPARIDSRLIITGDVIHRFAGNHKRNQKPSQAERCVPRRKRKSQPPCIPGFFAHEMYR